MEISFLLTLAGILLALAVAGAVFRRLGVSTVPVYILLGMVGGVFLADYPDMKHFLEEVGIALLLFFVGLEFSILRLRRNARRYAVAGGIDLAVNFPLGVAAGLFLGYGWPGSILLGGALYVSSSAIVAQNLSDFRRAAFPDTEIALGILVVEDILMGVFLALLAIWPAFAVEGVSPQATLAGLVALVLLVTVGAGPFTRLFERMAGAMDDEVLLLLVTGVLLLFSGATLSLGLSEALGAFVAGLLIGDTSQQDRIEHLLIHFKGLFAALFFFTFGATIPLGSLTPVLGVGLGLAALALLGKIVSGFLAGRSVGLGMAGSLNLGFTMTPRGEFSVLLAAYGVSVGFEALVPIVAVVVIVLAVVGTSLSQAGPRIATHVARRVEARLTKAGRGGGA